jgi:4-hydroxythreonine-4-phosphate dehydrogenase
VLRVVLETIHVALERVPALVTRESLGRTLKIAHAWASRFLSANAEVAVCGLNPHAGEAGHFGNEEADVIVPAIAVARAGGMRVSGPHPADTVFHRALRGEFDMVVAMYHDQGLIPVKTLDFHGGVNITIGLPVIRTSPDHGTAFDIVGRGTADESSMVAAILRASDLARRQAALGATSTITGE